MVSYPSNSTRPAHGYTMVEMIIAVGVIAAFGALGLSLLGSSDHDHYQATRDRRNAQEIASLIMGAMAAGAPVIAPGDLSATIQNLVNGQLGTSGTFKGRKFQLPGLGAEEIAGAMRHLRWNEGMICYDPEPN